MKPRLGRRLTLSLAAGVLVGVSLGARAAAQGAGDIGTPPDIIITSTPTGPVFADPEGLHVICHPAGPRAWHISMRRSVCDGVAPSQSHWQPHAFWGLDPRPERRRLAAVGLQGTAAVPVSLGSANPLGRGAEWRVAHRHDLAVSCHRSAEAISCGGRDSCRRVWGPGRHRRPGHPVGHGARRLDRDDALYTVRHRCVRRSVPRHMDATHGATGCDTERRLDTRSPARGRDAVGAQGADALPLHKRWGSGRYALRECGRQWRARRASTLVHRRPDSVNRRVRTTPIRGVAAPRHTAGMPRRGALRLSALRTRQCDAIWTAVH